MVGLRNWATALAVSLAAALSQIAAAQAATLNPAGGWSITSDDESCTISRPFTASGTGDTTLYIRSYGPGAAAQVSINGPTMIRDNSRSITAQISFDDEEPDNDTVAIATEFGDAPMLVFQLMLPQHGQNQATAFARGFADRPFFIYLNFASDARSITVAARDEGLSPQTLAIGSMDEPLEMLRDCELDLIESWGFDRAQQAGLSRAPALTNRAEVNSLIKIPAAWIISRVSQIVQFRLRVDETGHVDGCTIQYPAWERQRLRQACRAISNEGQFTPARDANGDAVPALWRATMFFVRSD